MPFAARVATDRTPCIKRPARRAVPMRPQITSLPSNSSLTRKPACSCGGSCPKCQAQAGALRIGPANDKYEREADRVSDQVMRMSAGGMQRRTEERPDQALLQAKPDIQRQPEKEEEEMLQAKPNIQRQPDGEEEEMLQAKPDIQRQPEKEEEEELIQAKPGSAGAALTAPNVTSAINSMRGGGKPLPPSSRMFFEPRFGRDFSRVRIHSGTTAAQSAKSINARAYTLGRNIVFGSGEYAPGTDAGKRLLAHELTHVVQQSQTAPSGYRLYRKKKYKYGHTDDCPQSFLEKFVWPGHDLAKKMVVHALYALCAANYGNPTKRNEEARDVMRILFGKNWKSKSSDIYKTLWKIRAGIFGSLTYDCMDTGRYFCSYDPPDIEWANTGKGSSEINLCHENFVRHGSSLQFFSQVVIHEMAHSFVSHGHGSDDVSGTCAGEVDDAQCYGELAGMLWKWVDPEYTKNSGDLCLGGGPKDPKQWD